MAKDSAKFSQIWWHDFNQIIWLCDVTIRSMLGSRKDDLITCQKLWKKTLRFKKWEFKTFWKKKERVARFDFEPDNAKPAQQQCDQMARLSIQHLAIYAN